MKQLEKWEAQIVAWNHVHGIKPNVARQLFFVQCESDEFRLAKGIDKLIEAGDYAFVSIFHAYLLKKINSDWHTGIIECMNHIKRLNAEKFVDAVIASNWTKYVQAKDTGLFRMSQEAASIAEAYKDRYSGVVPVRSGDYYFIKGLEKGKDGVLYEKVLKPSTFIKAKEFI